MSSTLQRGLVVVLIIVVVIVALNFVPDIALVRSALDSRLPLWLAGLAAPIVYVLKKLGNVLGLGSNSPGLEDRIALENARIRAELARLQSEVKEVHDRREAELGRLRQQLEAEDRARVKIDEALAGARRELREDEARLRTGGVIPIGDDDD